MRIPGHLFLFLPYIASVGCFSDSTAVEPYSVSTSAPQMGVAVGETATVSVSVQATNHEDYGGCGAGPQLPSLTVDRVTCSPDCVVSDQHATSFTVSAGSAGLKTVDIVTSTSDGKSSTETVGIEFREATRIEAVREATSPSGTLYAMFPGDAQQWSLNVADEKGPLLADLCNLQLQSSGAIETQTPCRPGGSGGASAAPLIATVRAAASGSGSVTMHFGKAVRTDRIEVIDPATIRRAELVVSATGTATAIESMSLTAPLPEPLILRYKCDETSNPIVVVRFETDDGTVAFGGTTVLRTDPLGALGFTALEQSARIKLTQVVDGTIHGDFGADGGAAISIPYVVRAGCASADGDTTDAGALDAADARDGAGGAVDAGTDANEGGS